MQMPPLSRAPKRLVFLALCTAPACTIDVGLGDSSTTATEATTATTADEPTTSATSGPDPDPTTTVTEAASSGDTTAGAGSACPDGVLDDGEACDDGNLSNDDECTNACQPQACGDGFLGPGEVCDDGSADGGCSSDCTCALQTCGDGALDDGERCDDGNTTLGDGCSACCQREMLHVFVTSKTFPIEFGGSFDADVRCMIAAEEAGIPGDSSNNFAWLGLGGFTISEYIGVIPRPYALLDGTVVAANREELFSGYLQAAINVTEFGETLPGAIDACAEPSLRVWTGIAIDGSTVADANCSDWSSSSGIGRFGSAGASDSRWTDCGEDLACAEEARLYCFEIPCNEQCEGRAALAEWRPKRVLRSREVEALAPEFASVLDELEVEDREAFLAALADADMSDADAAWDLTTVPRPAYGQYQTGAAYGNWGMPGYSFTSWDQNIYISQIANNTFWNTQVSFAASGGYLGLQRLGGTDIVLFSIFGATATQAGTGTICTVASEAGYGYANHRECKLTLSGIAGQNVRLLLVNTNLSDPANRWYAAFVWVGAGAGKWIGNIRGPTGIGRIKTAVNFTEYFGPGAGWNGTKCVAPGPPNSTALFGRPIVGVPGMADKTLSYSSSSLNKCPGKAGFSNPFNGTIAMHLGDV